MAKINTYRSGSASSLNPINNNVTPPVTTSATSSATRFKMPTGEKWLNLVVSSILPGLLYWGLSSLLLSHGVNFFLSHIIGYGLALMLLAYIQAVFKSGSELAKPIQIILTSILILCLSLHYLPDYGKVNKNDSSIAGKTSSFKSETLTFVGKERLVAKAYLPIGKEYRITVHGSCVNFIKLADIEVLAQEHGTYIFKITSEGSLIFDGTGSQSIITIEWRE